MTNKKEQLAISKVYEDDIYPAVGLKYCHLGYWHPDNEDDFTRAQEDLIKEIVSPLALKSSDVVLDVGGGNADTALWLHRTYGCKVVVVDIVPRLIELAHERIRTNQCEAHIEAICADILSLDFPEQHFDHIISIGVMHHISDKSALMTMLYRILKPGGKMAISTYALLFRWPLLRQLYLDLSLASRSVDPPSRYEEAMSEAGFTAISRRNPSASILLPSSEKLWAEPYYSRLKEWHIKHYGRVATWFFATVFTKLHFYILRKELLQVLFFHTNKP